LGGDTVSEHHDFMLNKSEPAAGHKSTKRDFRSAAPTENQNGTNLQRFYLFKCHELLVISSSSMAVMDT
jgi:hypothetical protein